MRHLIRQICRLRLWNVHGVIMPAVAHHPTVCMPVSRTWMIGFCFAVIPGLCVYDSSVAKSDDIQATIKQHCIECHRLDFSEGRLDLESLPFDLAERSRRERWIQVFERVKQGEMPPEKGSFSDNGRTEFLRNLATAIHNADTAEVAIAGRGPMRRLNRDEYQQNLRDILLLPTLDIRDILPEDREAFHFSKSTGMLDMSRVQLTAYLDAAEAALHHAVASGIEPPETVVYRAVGTDLFSVRETFGNRQAMFFARESKAIDNNPLDQSPHDPTIEMALFRSAHWPYYGYPKGFAAQHSGEYRVRFAARAVLQLPDFELKPATRTVPMTFRARKPSGPDVSGDVRATGGLIDVRPEPGDYETTVFLREGETFEYSLLGLPVPLARNVNNGPPTYRYPPFPEGGQPGIAFRWLEIEGPLSPNAWPPDSHRVLFAELPIRASGPDAALAVEVVSDRPSTDARRLLRRFVDSAARQPMTDADVETYELLIESRLKQGAPFAEAMITGYKAFLCSGHMLYLHEPGVKDPGRPPDHFAVASRLSHFLTNTRPDFQLMDYAARLQLRDAQIIKEESSRLIRSDGFERFVQHFTDYWLDLRHLYRHEPDVRLYPDYRFDDYLVESMGRETRAFFQAMVLENLPVEVLIKADFVFANDTLARHYGLPSLSGSHLRKVPVPDGSPYGGLLTQAAILKVTANGTSTSPVIRGAWIMDRLMGQAPPPPPASVPAVEPDIRGARTIPELLALHTESRSCAECHTRFDPVGLGLENFDIWGGWRTRYRGLESGERVSGIDRAGHDFAFSYTSSIDASGKLRDGRRFSDVHQLKQLLVSEPRRLAKNLLQQFTVYATGTPVRFSDRAEIESILDVCAVTDYRAGDLLHSFIQSRIFLGAADGPASGSHPQ